MKDITISTTVCFSQESNLAAASFAIVAMKNNATDAGRQTAVAQVVFCGTSMDSAQAIAPCMLGIP
jgi:hypothetical protein